MWATHPLVEQQVRMEQYQDALARARREALAARFARAGLVSRILSWLRPAVFSATADTGDTQDTVSRTLAHSL